MFIVPNSFHSFGSSFAGTSSCDIDAAACPSFMSPGWAGSQWKPPPLPVRTPRSNARTLELQ